VAHAALFLAFAAGDLEGFVAKRNAAVPIGHLGEGWELIPLARNPSRSLAFRLG
jgi:hypothetical protein